MPRLTGDTCVAHVLDAGEETPALFPYQLEGAKWLSGKTHALLADEMGLGKSAQSVTAVTLVGAERVLVLCPAVARANWAREFEKFGERGTQVVVLDSLEKIKGFAAGVGVVSYDYVARHGDHLRRDWDVVVADESHFLKNRQAQRVKSARKIAAKAKRIWFLSGTPMPNEPSELWFMLSLFGVYPGGYGAFVAEYCDGYDGPYGHRITGPKRSSIPKLRALLSQIMLRRKKEEVMAQLPPISFSDVYVEAGPVDEAEHFTADWFASGGNADLLRQHVKEQHEMVCKVAEGASAQTWVQALGGLEASTATLRRYIALQKVKGTCDMLKSELESGLDKVVIFAIHRGPIETLREELARYGAVTVYGGTDPAKRQRNIDKFQTDPKCRVFIGNIFAAGTSITLTAAHHVVFLEASWSPGPNAQAAMRCHRIGQERPVFVRFVLLDKNNIDRRVQKALMRKTQDAVDLGL